MSEDRMNSFAQGDADQTASFGHGTLRCVLVLAMVFAVMVVSLGAYTRLTSAGLGCPDWPGCYGHWVVPKQQRAIAVIHHDYPKRPLATIKAWTEMVHRYAAGTLALLIVLVAWGCVRLAAQGAMVWLIPAFGLLLLVMYQALLGMWTVTLKLWPIVVTQHLLGGLLLMGSLWFIYLILKRRLPLSFSNECSNNRINALSVPLGWRFSAGIGLVLVLLQILLGAWTSTNYAALSCDQFPQCQLASWHWQWTQAFQLSLPHGLNFDGGRLSEAAKKTIQMVHRIGALSVVSYWLVWTVLLRYVNRGVKGRSGCSLLLWPSQLWRSIVVLGLLLIGQACLGVTMIYWRLPVWVALMHTLGAAGIWLTVIAINVQLWIPRRQQQNWRQRQSERQPEQEQVACMTAEQINVY